MKIYTRTGDKGQTSLFGGERVSKANSRVAAYGNLDELNSWLGLCVVESQRAGDKLKRENDWLIQIQKDLFVLGSWLASKEASERVARGEPAYAGARADRTQLNQSQITAMETQIDAWEKELPPLQTFLLPGGSALGAKLHYARSLCRKAERDIVALADSGEVVPELVVQYLNRLADALFVCARFSNAKENCAEIPWI